MHAFVIHTFIRCLVLKIDGALSPREWKEALWVKFIDDACTKTCARVVDIAGAIYI